MAERNKVQRMAILTGTLVTVALTLAGAAAVAAENLTRIETRPVFVNLVSGRELQRFGVAMSFSPEGAISGVAFGSALTGRWDWEGDYLCRSIDYAHTAIPPDCQVVRSDGGTVSFTGRRGKGSQADYRLR